MPRQKAHITYNNFVKGLVTEASEINFPPQASVDEDNCVLFRQGNRRRRLGIDYVSGSSLSTYHYAKPSFNSNEFSYYRWKAPAGDGTKIFNVFQLSTVLYVYNAADLSFINSIDLTAYAISGATNIGNDKVKMTASRGKLFVVGKQLDPFYITYTSPSTLTVNSITLNTRDFTGLDDGLDVQNTPATLSNLHEYNLRNQGWFVGADSLDHITEYFNAQAHYPANNQIWFVGKNSSANLDTDVLEKTAFGNTPAPKGHYIINPFNIDRTTVSGVSSISVESITKRPQCIASFAGRVWYSGVDADTFNGTVYFSQILKNDISNAGNCYQVADPTSENDSDLVDDDGGELPIADIGRIIDMQAVGDTLCIFATNGIWGITGGADSYFKATSFSVYQITNIGADAIDSICLVEGNIFYWSKLGIYTLIRDSISGRFSVQSITKNVIQSIIDDITSPVLKNVQTIYDEKTKQVQFLYSNTDDDTSYTRDKVLILDLTLNAFFKYSISHLASNSPLIIGAIDSDNTNSWNSSSIRYITAVPNAGDYKFVFSEFNNTDFMDWYTKDSTGITYSSYLEAGYEFAQDIMTSKQSPIVNAYFQQTETAFALDEDDVYQLVNPSSCFLQAKWEWSNTSSSNRWSTERQVYRLQRQILPDEDDLTFTYGQSVIVTRNKVRGKGRAVRTRWRSEDGKDFNLLGWAILYTTDSDV